MSKRLQLFEKLLANGSQDPFHFYGRAMELRSLDRLEDALAAFMDLTVSHPNYVPSYLMAAQLAQSLGRIEQARAVAEAGIATARREGDDHALGELSAHLNAL